MSNDPYGERPSDPPPGGWGQDPAPGAGHDAGWGQDPIPTGGRPASVGKRVGAVLIDAIGVAIVLTIVLFLIGIDSTYLRTLIMAIGAVAYFAAMEAGSGQTVAKRLLNIKAVSEDGTPLTMQQAVMRRVPFYVGSVIPTILGGLIGFGLSLAILITAIQDDPTHQGIHDKWARTRVIDA